MSSRSLRSTRMASRPPKRGQRRTGSEPAIRMIAMTATSRVTSEGEVHQIAAELAREIGPLEGQLDGGLEPAHRGPGVISGAFEFVGEDRLLLHELGDRVGQLDLAAGPALGLLELVEDLRREHVAPDDRQVR